LKDIQRRHFNNMAGKFFDRIDAEDVIGRILEATPIVIEAMRRKLPNSFPIWIAESVFKGLQESVDLIERMQKT
jgi:serine/threonine-protein kinase HipA